MRTIFLTGYRRFLPKFLSRPYGRRIKPDCLLACEVPLFFPERIEVKVTNVFITKFQYFILQSFTLHFINLL